MHAHPPDPALAAWALSCGCFENVNVFDRDAQMAALAHILPNLGRVHSISIVNEAQNFQLYEGIMSAMLSPIVAEIVTTLARNGNPIKSLTLSFAKRSIFVPSMLTREVQHNTFACLEVLRMRIHMGSMLIFPFAP
jgi:hypothetical protein